MGKKALRIAAVCCVLLCGCQTFQNSGEEKMVEGLSGFSSYFDSIDDEEGEDYYMAEGKVHLSGKEDIFFIEPEEDMEVKVSCELKKEKGDARILYKAPDGTETVLAESGKLKGSSRKEETGIRLEAGRGSIEIEGRHAVCEFKVQLDGLDKDKIEYLNIYSPK